MEDARAELDSYLRSRVAPDASLEKFLATMLHAIYEYLSAIPCNEGPAAPSILHNDCH